ncbi:hypothetical protein [Fodinicola acaciae]|uniref:hypothetical protein n=1 Tax=Fodinicola acaciae TaxID=2681555 RepID=UPI0013D79BE9|nr:hypothetical protein [Fodinicola acaciae]
MADYGSMSVVQLQPLVQQTQQGIAQLAEVVKKWDATATALESSGNSLTSQTNALHGNWDDSGGDTFAASSTADATDLKKTADKMKSANVAQQQQQLSQLAQQAMTAIENFMKSPAALLTAMLAPPPAEVLGPVTQLAQALPKFGQAMVQAVQDAQGKWPQAGGSQSPGGGSPSASPASAGGGGGGGAGSGDQQGGGQQGQGQGQGQDGQGQDQGGGGGGGGDLAGQDPSLQGGTATPTLPPPTTTPLPTTPTPPPSTPLTPFAPIGGFGGGGKGIGGGGAGGGGGGGIGGPKNIPVAAAPIKATAAPSVGTAPSLSGTGTPASSGTTGATGGYSGIPPMMPFAGHGGANGVPKSGNGPRSVTGRGPKPSSRVPGLPPSLQGKSGTVDRNAFGTPAKPTRRERVEDTGTLQLLDEEMWQVDETPAAGNDAAPVRRLLQ